MAGKLERKDSIKIDAEALVPAFEFVRLLNQGKEFEPARENVESTNKEQIKLAAESHFWARYTISKPYYW